MTIFTPNIGMPTIPSTRHHGQAVRWLEKWCDGLVPHGFRLFERPCSAPIHSWAEARLPCAPVRVKARPKRSENTGGKSERRGADGGGCICDWPLSAAYAKRYSLIACSMVISAVPFRKIPANG